MKLDFGDVHDLGQAVMVAVRHRDPWVVVRIWRWIRWQRESGRHDRFTFADYLKLRRRRKRYR